MADSQPSALVDKRFRDTLKGFLDQHGCRAEWRMGGHDDPIPLLLRIDVTRSYTGLSADVLWAHKHWQRAALRRSIALNVMGRSINVLHPEDLILMKLDAAGPQDLLDVQALLASPPVEIDLRRLKRSATRVRIRKLLDTCLRAADGKTRS